MGEPCFLGQTRGLGGGYCLSHQPLHDSEAFSMILEQCLTCRAGSGTVVLLKKTLGPGGRGKQNREIVGELFSFHACSSLQRRIAGLKKLVAMLPRPRL